jgi:hypothetical protein
VGAHGAASLLAGAAGRLMLLRVYVEQGRLSGERGRRFYDEPD